MFFKKSEEKLNFMGKNQTKNTIKKMCNYIKEKGYKKFNYSYEIEIKKEGVTPEAWLKKII